MDSITRNRLILGLAVFAVLLAPVAVYAASFLDIRAAIVHIDSTKVTNANLITFKE